MPALPDFGSDLFWTRFSTRLSAALREKRIDEDVICEICEVTPNTVRHWRKGTANPSTENVFRIMALLGPDFVNDMLNLIGIGGAEEIDPGREIEAALQSAQGQLRRVERLLEHNHRPGEEIARIVGPAAECLYLISRIYKRVMPEPVEDRQVR